MNKALLDIVAGLKKSSFPDNIDLKREYFEAKGKDKNPNRSRRIWQYF
ncbi:MAG: hypothetical protein AAGA02_09155 [Bacteroidota bacterium]